MGPTFIHVEVFARQVAKGKKEARTAREVVSEAVREVNHVHHLTTPGDPILLFGDAMPDALLDTIEEKVATEKDPLGRRIRSDKPILLAGVSSFPLRWDELADVEGGWAKYEQWKALTEDFLKAEYGENLSCILEHTDEDRPHLHFYAYDKNLAAETRFLHPGFAAAKGLEGQEQAKAHREGCKRYQDSYWAAVGLPVGLTRVGPKRNRLTREEWKKQKETAVLVSGLYAETAQKNKQAKDLFVNAQEAWDKVASLALATQKKAKATADEASKAMVEAIRQGKEKVRALLETLERKDNELDATFDEMKKKGVSLEVIKQMDKRTEPTPKKLIEAAKKTTFKKP